MDITSGTIQIQSNGKTLSGKIYDGTFTNESRTSPYIIFSATIGKLDYSVSSDCSILENNLIGLRQGYISEGFSSPVECSSSQGAGNTSSSSMSGTATTAQDRDSDGDGIPDSGDRCASNSNQRCYKESK
ncbi:MAG TPA: hypothetical protein VGE97_02860 [Nitrososphaera sp.]